MKKISTFFMSAICMVALMSVTSCKDYDDDQYFDQNSFVPTESNFKDLLELQRKGLQDQIDVIKAHIKAHIENCNCDARYAELKNEIANLNAQLTNLTNQLNNKLEASDLEALNTLIANLQTQIDDLQAKLNNLQIPEACNCAGKWEQLAIDLDALKSDINNLKANQEANNTAIEQLNGSITQLSNSISTVQGDIISLTNAITQLQQEKASVEDLNKAVASIDSLKNDLEGTKADMLERIGALRELINSVIGRLDYFGGSDQTIEEVVGNLYENVNTLQTDYLALYDRLGTLEGKAAADSAWIANLKELYGDNLENLATKSDLEVLASKEELDKAIAEVKNSITDLEAKVDSLAAAQADFEEVVSNTIQQLQDWIMTEIEQPLKQEIYNINEKLTSVEERVTALETTVLEITGLLDQVQNELKSQITGIVMQACTTPVLGNMNLNMGGLQTTWLCAYSGSLVSSGKKFPSSSSAGYVGDDADRLTADEIANIEGATVSLKEESFQSKAGKIYLTINPTGVDYTKVPLKLVDSQNNPAGIELRDLRPSNYLVQTGISRSVENGFYEADAYVSDVDKAKLHFGDLKDVAKDVKTLIQEHKASGLKTLAADILVAAKNHSSAPAYALQTSYFNHEGTEKFIHSQYNIAATAITPLSYNYSEKVPSFSFSRHIPYLSDLIDRVLKNVKTKMYFEFDGVNYIAWTNVTVDTIKFVKDSTYIKVAVQYDLPTEVDPISGEVTKTKPEQLEVPITGSDLNNMVGVINDAIQKDMVAKLNSKFSDVQVKFVDAVNTALMNTADKINTQIEDVLNYLSDIAATTDKPIQFINNLLDKIYSRLENAGTYLLPTMFLRDANGDFKLISTFESGAGYVTPGYLNLFPTSYTLETINPAYKKVVTVTKAIKGGVNDVAAVKRANQNGVNVNKVVDGAYRTVGIKVESGYTYEIAYAAVDYKGFQTCQRYYIKVK